MKKYLTSVIYALAILSGCAPAYAGPSAGIVQSLFVQKGVGAVPRTFQDKAQEQINVKDFGAKCDGVTDDAPAIQKAINALAGGGTVRFPDGATCRMNSGVTFATNLRVLGGGKMSTTIKAYGANGGLPFFNQTGGDVLGFESITLSGNGTTVGPIADAGSIGYSAYNNSYSENSEFIYWETVTTWKGGYYHKHNNSYFEYSKTLFSGYNQNNLSFVNVRWANFQTGLTVASGEGPISFTGGSIEYIGDKAFQSTNSRQVSLTMTGTYIENRPTAACPSGITCASGKFDQGVVVYSNGPEIYPVVIQGTTVFTPGIFRMVYFDSTQGSHLVSQGNRYIARGIGPTNAIYAFSGASAVGLLHDEIIGALPGGAVYASGLPASLEGSSVWDPVARQQLRPTVTGYTNLTLQNGFTNTGGSFSSAGYVMLPDGTVRLRGVINGSGATAAVVATLPAGFQPANVKVYSVASVSGAGSNLQLMVYPSGALILNGTAPFANQIGIDGITFRVGE